MNMRSCFIAPFCLKFTSCDFLFIFHFSTASPFQSHERCCHKTYSLLYRWAASGFAAHCRLPSLATYSLERFQHLRSEVTIITWRMASMRRATFCLPMYSTNSPSIPVRALTMRTCVRAEGRRASTPLRGRSPSPVSAYRFPRRAPRRACRRKIRSAPRPGFPVPYNIGGGRCVRKRRKGWPVRAPVCAGRSTVSPHVVGGHRPLCLAP